MLMAAVSGVRTLAVSASLPASLRFIRVCMCMCMFMLKISLRLLKNAAPVDESNLYKCACFCRAQARVGSAMLSKQCSYPSS